MEKLTREVKNIIIEAIDSLPDDLKNDDYAICDRFAEITVNRYIGDPNAEEFMVKRITNHDNFEYQLNRMKVQTTKQIMEKIYLFKLYVLKKKYGKFFVNEFNNYLNPEEAKELIEKCYQEYLENERKGNK